MNPIVLDIELDAIRSFLNMVRVSIKNEYLRIETHVKNTQDLSGDDIDNLYFYPFSWEEIAIKASLGELNALLEFEIMHIAVVPFSTQMKQTTQKKMLETAFWKNIKVAEAHYGFAKEEVSNLDDIKAMRSKVNSFKHQKGFKNPLIDHYATITEKHSISFADAFKAIESTRQFIIDIWSKTLLKTR